MTSRRRNKKAANQLGLTETELMLAELVEELLEEVRWLHVLGYSNQFLMNRHLDVDPKERDRILEAATREVEKHQKLHEWKDRVARIKARVADLDRIQGRKSIAPGRDIPGVPSRTSPDHTSPDQSGPEHEAGGPSA